jgi:ribonuclease HI
VAEWTKEQASSTPIKAKYWTMYFDGSLTLEEVGAGVLLISPSGDKLRYALQLHFWATDNVVEYEALLHGIRVVVELGTRCLFM